MNIYNDDYNGYLISKELTEHYDVEYHVITYTESNNVMHIMINPPTERDDLFYFKVFNNDAFKATKVARISLLIPEYIHCSDNPEWILNEQEKINLISILSSGVWNKLLYNYEKQLKYLDNYKKNLIGLPMPDYSKL